MLLTKSACSAVAADFAHHADPIGETSVAKGLLAVVGVERRQLP
jgi:hypothetical protein